MIKERVRAIIIKNKSVLIIHRIKKDKDYYVFPGGGVEETDTDKKTALARECKEELGVDVLVGELFAEEKFGDESELFYFCEIIEGEIGSGAGPEYREGTGYEGKYVFEWVLIDEFSAKKVLPEKVKNSLQKWFFNGLSSKV
jgi:8-oxo-dGTP pyrophosphatase MutT (NUDIX family)